MPKSLQTPSRFFAARSQHRDRLVRLKRRSKQFNFVLKKNSEMVRKSLYFPAAKDVSDTDRDPFGYELYYPIDLQKSTGDEMRRFVLIFEIKKDSFFPLYLWHL